AATIACYIPDEREMVQFISEMVKDQGKNIEPDAANWLGQALKGDRGRARMEIEKLCIYAGGAMHLTLTDAQASCGEVGDQGIDDLVYAVFGRDPLGVQKSYKRLLEEGTELIIIERSLQNHIRRLHQVKMMMDEDGLPIEMAMKLLQPPIFFKQEEKFRTQVSRYSGIFLRKLLQRFNEIEAETKRTGTPSETLVSDALIKLAAL
ncbi:MAG: DNA polymerase III subunit delta, partial [Pseudomonadota bacterium]